jgi:glycosyltransferase involved in cell wall biosynthesis
MKVLLVHNDYGKYSGEEAVVDKMALLFQDLGHEVAQLRMSTADSRENLSGKIHGFVSGIYCPSGVRAMREAIERERPDVVNVHNLYPFISPAALRECKKAGVPVIMTVHNFRLICPTGLFMRNNLPCEICLQRGNEWGCIRYNCEHSLCKSIGYAARNAVARTHRHYLDCVDRFACITDFQRRKLIEAGYPKEKLLVIPNTLDVASAPSASEGSQDYIAYCGRISREKGVDLILNVARRHPEIPFRLAGAVREPELVENLPTNVTLAGYLTGEGLENFYRNARFMVMASRWYEGFPMAILEAAKYGKPMIAPNHGGFSEIIGQGEDAIGVLTKPGVVRGLEKAVVSLWNNPEEAQRLGRKAFEKLKERYASDVVAQQWKALLEDLNGHIF